MPGKADKRWGVKETITIDLEDYYKLKENYLVTQRCLHDKELAMKKREHELFLETQKLREIIKEAIKAQALLHKEKST